MKHPPHTQWVSGDSPQTFLSFYTLPFYSVINWLYKLHGLVASFLQLPHPPFHSNASNYCFSSVALQYGFRRPCEFHHVFGVDSSYGSYPSLDVTWENRMLIFKLGCLVLFFFFFDPIVSTIATTRSSKPGSMYLNALEL